MTKQSNPPAIGRGIVLFHCNSLCKSDTAAAVWIRKHDDLNPIASRIDSFYLGTIRCDGRIYVIRLQDFFLRE